MERELSFRNPKAKSFSLLVSVLPAVATLQALQLLSTLLRLGARSSLWSSTLRQPPIECMESL
jgi:threonine/homoserine efflux transporter RhtA